MGATRPLWQWGALACVSLALASALQWAALPAALLLGPMIAGIVFGLNGATVRVPRPVFLAAQAVIGCLIARAITASILATIAESWLLMLLVILATVLASGLVGWLLVRFGGLPGTTAAWGSSPGAASAMVVMAEEFGADPRLVAFMQYLRVIVVTLTASLVSRLLLGAEHVAAVPSVPAAHAPLSGSLLPLAATLLIAGAGAFLGQRLKIPSGALLVPLTLGALLHSTETLAITIPQWLLVIAYGALGWYIGLRFNRGTVLYALRTLPEMLLSTVILIGLCGLSAWVLTRLLHTDGLTAYLATSPGGLDSVAIIAVGSDANVPFVLALQTLRLLVVIVTGPPLARMIARSARGWRPVDRPSQHGNAD